MMTAIPSAPGSFAVATPNLPGGQAATAKLSGRVLLAEDGQDNRQILSLYLRRAGADVVLAENGRVAVERAAAENLNLILMDIEMPELDGFAATRQLRAAGCTLPIIALTAHTSPENQNRCFAAGCTSYVNKPIDKGTLLNCVAPYLGRGEPAATTIPGSTAPAAEPQPTAAALLKSSFADDPEMREPDRRLRRFAPHAGGLAQEIVDREQSGRFSAAPCTRSKVPAAAMVLTSLPGSPPRWTEF